MRWAVTLTVRAGSVTDDLVLVEPDVSYRKAFIAMAEDYRRAGEHRHQQVSLDEVGFATYVQTLQKASRGIGLRSGWVPATTYWLMRPNSPVILGVSVLRHWLTATLEKEGGHIGYMITPSQRRKGYGTQQLALCLEKACAMGLDRVLVTCDTDNVGSARIIQNNGGVFEDEVISDISGKPVSRYWIELRRPWL
jgi:predicted acetyltransferase